MAGKPKYVSPSYEIVDGNGGGGSYFVRLAYGYVGARMDTSNMTTQEVIEEFLRMKGAKTPNEFFDKKFRGKDTEQKENTPANDQPEAKKIDSKQQVDKMMSSDRMQWGRVVTKESVERALNGGTEEAKELVTRLFNEDGFGIGTPIRSGQTAFYSGYNKVGLSSDTFASGEKYAYSQGGIFYHECWHAIDENYGEQELHKGLSNSYITSTGKTFSDTLVEDYNANIKGKVMEIRKDFDKEVEEYYSSQGYDRKAILAEYKRAEEESYRIWNEEYNLTKSYPLANAKRREYWESEEYKKAKDLYRKVSDEYPGAVLVKWGDLSDVISGATKNKLNFGMQHKASYWKGGFFDTWQDKRASEAFAECASAKSTNPASYELLKKYLPNTVKAFEEIYDKLNKGEIKPNANRHKWQG